MKIAKQIREVLEELLDMTEEEGSARVELTISQAETYARFYEGLKLESAIQSLELLEPDDPLYAWGHYCHHDVSVKRKSLPTQYPLGISEAELKARRLQEKRTNYAWLEVRIREEIVATLKMYMIRATVAPLTIPDLEVKTITSRRKKLVEKVIDPGLKEKINRLSFIQRGSDVWVGIVDRRVEKIPTAS